MREENSISVLIEESEQETKVPLIFQTIVEFVIGIFLIIYRDMTTNVLFIVIGSLMTCYGAFDLIAFVTNNRPYSFRRGLTTGVLITIIGIAFIVQAQHLSNLLAIIIGALVLVESIVNCRRALIIRSFGSQKWYLLLIVSAVAIIIGILICIYPNLFGSVISLVMGIAVIFVSLIDICAILLMSVMRGRVKKQYPNASTQETSVIDLQKK